VLHAKQTRGQGIAWALRAPPGCAAHATYRFAAALLHAEELPADTHAGVQLPPLHARVCVEGGGGACGAWWLPPLAVELPSPDFSMPYNVITFVSTVAAFTAGSVLNVLGRRARGGG